MTVYGKSSRWTAALAFALAGLIGVGSALVRAAPAPSVTTPFELTLETALTPPLFMSTEGGTFTSRAPFCASGRFVEFDRAIETVKWRFTCDDGSGSVTVAVFDVAWRIIDGSGSYAGARGEGSLRGEQLCKPWLGETCDLERPLPWRCTLLGVVHGLEPETIAPTIGDTVAPTIAIASARAAKLRRPEGAYSVKLALALRDDIEGNPVSYELWVVTARGKELAWRFGTATTGAVSMTLRIRPPDGARLVRLQLAGDDPVGNMASVSRALKLPR